VSVRNVPVADTNFLLRSYGEGPGTPVLLLHGVPETSSCWRDVAPALAVGRRVLAPDLPGLGGSVFTGPYDVATLVAQVAALIQAEVTGGQVDVVGHDWGGVLALALAGDRPDLVRRLVIANAPGRHLNLLRAAHVPFFSLPVAPGLLFRAAGRSVVQAMLALAWKSPTPLDAETRAEYTAAYSDPERVHAMLGYYRAATRPQLRQRLHLARAPGHCRVRAERILVLWGARDPVLPVSCGESLVRDLGPTCAMVTVPAAGHFVIEEAPEVVTRVLLEVLDDTAPGREDERSTGLA